MAQRSPSGQRNSAIPLQMAEPQDHAGLVSETAGVILQLL